MYRRLLQCSEAQHHGEVHRQRCPSAKHNQAHSLAQLRHGQCAEPLHPHSVLLAVRHHCDPVPLPSVPPLSNLPHQVSGLVEEGVCLRDRPRPLSAGQVLVLHDAQQQQQQQHHPLSREGRFQAIRPLFRLLALGDRQHHQVALQELLCCLGASLQRHRKERHRQKLCPPERTLCRGMILRRTGPGKL